MVNSMHDFLHIIYSYSSAKGDQWALDKFALIAGNRIARQLSDGEFDRIENQFGQCTCKLDFEGTTYIRVALTPEDYAILDGVGDSIGPIKREVYPATVMVDDGEGGQVEVPNREDFVAGTYTDPETQTVTDVSLGGW